MGEVPWYVMRYLPGGSVRDLKMNRDRKGQIQWDTTSFDWLVQIASALDYLHGRNCFHRDVKPENILFSGEGTPYLVDFGIVKSVSETTTMITEQGKAVGTLAYMAPEILEDGEFTAQSDQYALAVTLYESITGDRPFSGTSYFALFKSIQKGHQKLSDRFPKMPEEASNVVDRALMEEPTTRFESCGDFASQFITRLAPSVISAEPIPAAIKEDITRAHSAASKATPQGGTKTAESNKQKRPLFDSPVNEQQKEDYNPTWLNHISKWALFVLMSLVLAFPTFIYATTVLQNADVDHSVGMPVSMSIAGAIFLLSLAILGVRTRNQPIREIALAFLASFSVATLTGGVAFYVWMVVAGGFSANDWLEGLIFFAAQVVGVLILISAFKWSRLWNFYYLLAGMTGQVVFATWFKFFYEDRAHAGERHFGGDPIALLLVVFIACLTVPLLVGWSQKKLESITNQEILIQLGALFAAGLCLPIWWITSYPVRNIGGGVSSASSILPLVVFLFCFLYRPYRSPNETRTVLDHFNFLRIRPKTTVTIFLLIATLLWSVRFDWSLTLTKFAANLGNTRSMLYMADRYESSIYANLMAGREGIKDAEQARFEAFDWYTKAANAGSVEAQFELAEICDGENYRFADSSDFDELEEASRPREYENEADALFWYRKAAEQGNKVAVERAQEMVPELSEGNDD